METRGYPHVGSVEIGNRDIRRRRAGIGYCRNLGNCGRVALSDGADRGSTKLGAAKTIRSRARRKSKRPRRPR
jgi:hypothetical protein